MSKEWRALVAERIKSLRLDAGWSQLELGRRAGINHSSVSRFESGSRIPSLNSAIRLSVAFNIGLYYLCGHDELKEEMEKNYE